MYPPPPPPLPRHLSSVTVTFAPPSVRYPLLPLLCSQVFSKVIDKLYAYVHPKTGKKAGLIADDVYEIIQQNKQRLNSAIIMDRDFDYDYFGFKTLEK